MQISDKDNLARINIPTKRDIDDLKQISFLYLLSSDLGITRRDKYFVVYSTAQITELYLFLVTHKFNTTKRLRQNQQQQ